LPAKRIFRVVSKKFAAEQAAQAAGILCVFQGLGCAVLGQKS
jgi:hypothetical protein